MVDSSRYLRDLAKSDLAELRLKYALHMKRTKSGFLEKPVKERLLGNKRWEEYSNDDDVYDFFYKIREHARTALGDFMLISDILSESQLKDIFCTEVQKEELDKVGHNPDHRPLNRLLQSNPRIENILRGILKDSKIVSPTDEKEWKNRQLSEQSDAWKFFFAQEIVRICFDFFKNNDFITSKAHERVLDEVRDMLDSESKNIFVPRLWRRTTWV